MWVAKAYPPNPSWRRSGVCFEGIAALNSGIDEDIEKVEIPAKARLKRKSE